MNDNIFEDYRCKVSLYTAKGCSKAKVIKAFSFNNFTEKEVITDIEDRKYEPEKVDQCNTGLCGIAAIAYMYASRNYADYAQFVINMHRNGIATSKAGYMVKTDQDNHLQDYSRRSPSYPRNNTGT